MSGLCFARLLIAWVPFADWRKSLGFVATDNVATESKAGLAQAEALARHVERAAFRLPFETKCLPRAMLLSWLLRRRNVGHSVVFAARPPGHRNGPDNLHAWVDIGGTKVIGDLPGPWIETLRLGQ
jgi:hypothetical protein